MKFQMQMDDSVYAEVNREARKRGVSIQELLRTTVVPEWMRSHPELFEK